MPENQRARLNWLDRVILFAAVVVVAAAILMRQQSVVLKHEIRTSRAVTCAGQLVVTGSTVPACRSVADLARER